MSGHTDSLVAAVQQLRERRCGSLGLDGLCSFFVLSQFTQDAGRHALDVLDGRVEQLPTRENKTIRRPVEQQFIFYLFF